MEQKHWTIYCHIHIDSSRRYIGLTSQTIEKRWKNHIYAAKSSKNGKWHFPNAIQKYGPEAFSHEILEVCDTLETAKLSEIKWIKFYNTRDPGKGFNSTKGGDYIPPTPKIQRTEISKRLWQDPEFRSKMLAATWNRPGYRQKVLESLKRTNATPESKENHSVASKTKWQDPNFRIRNAESYKTAYLNPINRNKRIETMKKTFATPESKSKRSKSSKLVWQNPELRAKDAERWKDPVYRAKCQHGLIRGTELNKRKTHCPHGHEYSIKNTWFDKKGHRFCLTCKHSIVNECMRKLRLKRKMEQVVTQNY